MHPSISITAPPALRVGGEDRSCVWARAGADETPVYLICVLRAMKNDTF